MINNTDFAKRLKNIMEYYQLSASAFADKIRVQRSSISHLLSGRNKPSLDFVLKVVREFNEVDLYWLLNGKGSFPKANTGSKTPAPTQNIISSPTDPSHKKIEKLYPKELTALSDSKKNIERIVIFFNDGTFKEYVK